MKYLLLIIVVLLAGCQFQDTSEDAQSKGASSGGGVSYSALTGQIVGEMCNSGVVYLLPKNGGITPKLNRNGTVSTCGE